MNAEYFRTLFDYQYWARDRLLAAVQQVSVADYLAARPMDYGSIHGTMVHVHGGEVIWHSRWSGESPTRRLNSDEMPNLEALTQHWIAHEQRVRDFLSTLSDEDVRTSVISYLDNQGNPNSRPLWHMMAHAVNHGTHHRSEVAAAATQLGHSPGDLDLIVYFNR